MISVGSLNINKRSINDEFIITKGSIKVESIHLLWIVGVHFWGHTFEMYISHYIN